MDYIFQFDIAAAALSLVIFALTFIRRNFPCLRIRIFRSLLVINFCASLLEVFVVFLSSKNANFPVWVCHTVFSIELAVHYTVHFAYLLYVVVIVRDNIGKTFERILFASLFGLGLIFIFTNPLHQLIYSIDSSGVYTAHFGEYIIDGLALLSIVYSMVIMLVYNKKLPSYQVAINIVFFFILIVSIICELIFPKVLVENFVIAVSFSMLTLIFDNPEVYFHGKTTIYNETAFYNLYASKIMNKTPLRFLAFVFKDFDLVTKKFGYSRAHVAVLTTLKNCQRRYGKSNVFLLGREVMLIDTKNLNVQKEIDHISEACYKGGLERNSSLKLNCQFFVIYLPDEVNTYDDLKDAIYLNLFDRDHTNDETNVSYFDDKLFAQKRRNEEISLALHEAIENDGFEVHYQPLYQIKTKKYVGLEALVRLKNKVQGKYASPAEFIPLAEELGLIYQIDEIVFEKVCRFIRNTNIKQYGIRFIDVNLSLLKLLDSSTIDRYCELASRYEIEPNFINLEITETAEADQKYLSIVRENIERFREKGFTFSLDDYGSGYSTVVYMAEMDTKLVKIDASILWNALRSKKYYTILENCVRLVYCFDKECLVEGVENEQMVEMCRRLGVDYFQGYYYSKPITEDEIVEFLKKPTING